MVLCINSVADPRIVPAEGPVMPQQTPGPQQRTRRTAVKAEILMCNLLYTCVQSESKQTVTV